MTLENLLKKINDDAAAIEFDETIAAIDGAYNFTPSQFANGSLVNKAGKFRFRFNCRTLEPSSPVLFTYRL